MFDIQCLIFTIFLYHETSVSGTVFDFLPLLIQVGLGETLLEAESIEEQESPVNCFRKLFGKKIIMLFYCTVL